MSYPVAIEIGTALIRRFEDCSLHPVPDTGPIGWQIGWGMNYLPDGSPVRRDTPPIDQQTADDWLAERLSSGYARETDAMLAGSRVNDAQRGALYSFGWNEGEGALRGSALLRYVNAGRFDLAANEFRAWVYGGGHKLPGLVLRRQVEAAVFAGRITSAQIADWKPPAQP